MKTFWERFGFDPAKKLYVGVERERFLTSGGRIAPIAPLVLERLKRYGGRFGYELSACQLEDRVGPCSVEEVEDSLSNNDLLIAAAEMDTGAGGPWGSLHLEMGPEDMPLDVYPDPTGRYQEITRDMPRHVLLAACRILGTHVHIGMPDHETALRAYNDVISHCAILCERGNGSFGERLATYRIMAPDCMPQPYRDWEHFSSVATEKGFAEDPRRCWTLIRISVHGTIEFRMFGATSSLSRIVGWVRLCHDLCRRAMS
jgi:carboxylate-amine ligase